MIRVAHFSDLHYGNRTLVEADRCFGAAIDRAIALGVDAAVIAGDATDHPWTCMPRRRCGSSRRSGAWPTTARC